MPFRLRIFALHFLASAVVLSVALALFYRTWYSWPAWYLAGADSVAALVALVHLGAGPFVTLVIAGPTKPARQLRGDIAVIALVQLAALGYGLGTLWQARPQYYAFSAREIALVTAAEIKDHDIETALRRANPLAPARSAGLRWVWAKLPDDRAELGKLLAERLVFGEDVAAMPQYFRPWAEARTELDAAYRPLRVLRGLPGMDEARYDRRLAELGRPESALGLLPIAGRRREGCMIFDRASGEPLAFWPVTLPKDPPP